jgi:beta-lactamase regulating signal transducer with metallopeptidase domain
VTDLLRLIDHPSVATLGWTLTHFLWQGAVLGLVAFFILRVVRPSSASARYVVGVCVLAAMLLTPIATFVSSSGHSASSRRASQTTSTPTPVAGAGLVTGAIVANLEANPAAVRELLPPAGQPVINADEAPMAPTWLPIVTAVWMFGVATLSLRMLGGWLLTQLLARRAVRVVSGEIEHAAREMARRLRLTRRFRVLESAAVSVPTLVGWIRPVVLLPAAVLAGLSPAQLQAVIAHELAHIRRHDYLVNLLQTFVETLLFYHPAVWWVSAEIRAEREHCCDDLAVDVCGDRLVYVSALAELTAVERRSFALAATDGSLVTRVRRILGRPAGGRRELPPSWGILVLLIVVGGGAGSYEMSADATDVEQIARAAAVNAANRHSEAPLAPPTEPQPPLPLAEPVPLVPLAPAMPPAPEIPGAPVVPAFTQTFVTPAAPAAPPAPVVPPAAIALDAPVVQGAPVAPAAPSAPSQSGEGNFVWSNNGNRLAVKWTGPFRISDDERDIAWVQEGAVVTVSDGWVFTDRVELRGLAGGQVERRYYRSGLQREFDAEGRAFLTNVIQRMIRGGMFAAERVARLLKQGGPDAVLADVERLQTDSSYVKRVYYTTLLKQAELNAAQLSRLLDGVATMTSDFEKRSVLTGVLAQPRVTDEQRALAARAAARMASDYEQRVVLSAALAAASPAPVVVEAVLDALENVSSSHERSRVLLEIARKGALTPDTSARFMNRVTTMASDHERRQVLAAIAAAPVVATMVVRDSLDAVAAISSSHEKAEVLLEVIEKGIADDMVKPFFAAVDSLSSSHEKYRVLTRLASKSGMSDAVLTAYLQSVKGVSSGHERAQALLAVLKSHSLTGKHRTLFLEAAESIPGTHEQNQVLAALVRAERR